MKSIGRILSFVGPLAVVAAMASPAMAFHRSDRKPCRVSHSAPEIDPAALGSAVALLSGGALLLNARRKRA